MEALLGEKRSPVPPPSTQGPTSSVEGLGVHGLVSSLGLRDDLKEGSIGF